MFTPFCHLTLLYTLETYGILAVLDYGEYIPEGEPGHRRVVDLQQKLVLGQFASLYGHLALFHFTKKWKLAILRAPFQIEPQISLLAPGEDRLVDFVGPVVFLLQAF